MEQVFAAANLPLLRQPVRSAYNMHTLMANLQELTGLDFEPAPQPTESVPTTSFQATDSGAMRTGSSPVGGTSPGIQPRFRGICPGELWH